MLGQLRDQRATAARELQREADVLRRELRGLRAERERLSTIEERIARLRTPTRQAGDAAEAAPRVGVGETVRVASLGAVGIVRSLVSGGETAEVEVGDKRLKVAVRELSPTDTQPTASPREQFAAAGYLAEPTASRARDVDQWGSGLAQLDLRGLTSEEARYQVDRYLNEAYMQGVLTVRIVHGRGTGAVRQAVRDVLVAHPLVRTHQTAEAREGGEGATVVQLAS